MLNRMTRSMATLSGGLLALGLLGATTAGAADATTGNQPYAGYQTANTGWHFRYVQADFTVPLSACKNDDFTLAGVALIGSANNVAVGVTCLNGQVWAGYEVGYTGTTDPHQFTHVVAVAANDTYQATIYYDQGNNYDSLQLNNLTTGQSGVINDTHSAHGAMYSQAITVGGVANPPADACNSTTPGNSFILTPFSHAGATAYNGQHGGGLSGPWGSANQLTENNGAQTIAAAPLLYGGGTTFNVREYCNA